MGFFGVCGEAPCCDSTFGATTCRDCCDCPGAVVGLFAGLLASPGVELPLEPRRPKSDLLSDALRSAAPPVACGAVCCGATVCPGPAFRSAIRGC